MGLDITIKHMAAVDDLDKIYSAEELNDMFPDHYISELYNVEEHPDKPVIVGCNPNCIFRCNMEMYDYSKIVASKGENWADGWSWAYTTVGDPDDIPEEDKPNEEVIAWMSFVKDSTLRKRSPTYITVPVTNSNIQNFTVMEVWWICMLSNSDIGYMRKGANNRFYTDDIWDSDPICSKKIVEEHMKRYFNKTAKFGRFPQKEFKEKIFDKFEEGKDLCVYYC